MSARSTPRIDILRVILREGDDLMPKKYQSGKLEIRKDVGRPYYFVRASKPVADKVTGARRSLRKQYPLGFVDEINIKEARKLRAELLETINAGRFVAQSNVLFKDLVRRFNEIRLKQLGVTTQAQYSCQIKNHLLPAFGKLKLCEIDRPAVEEFLAVKADTLGWWARNNLRSILSALFKAAKDWKLFDGDSPTIGVRIGKMKFAREKRLLTVEQLRALLAALPDRLRFIALLQFGLGLRISETLGLKWKDVDFENGIVAIRRRWYRGDLSEQTKTETSTADLRLSPSMKTEIQLRYPGPHKREEFIFLGEDGKMPPDDRDLLRFEFRPVLRRLGLYYPGFGFHAFRRQNITWRQTIGGAEPLEAMKGARHGSLDMTLLYTLTDHERETAQQQAMFDYLMGKGGPVQ